MSLSAAHTEAFLREVPGESRVYTIRDSVGYPAQVTAWFGGSVRADADRSR